ncbi:Stp1/IreP family PP2C-type Ser/Thr phosphatase [Lachnoclostridium sp. An138]|uniref:Stp1/IreP family PP2C-type Ser/Thr phosphatase n=1 Tax=Lachnoclostridium sp. An138 TaxID=1965560 RepID=UPI000B39D566|nr:serine/threonine protein phosphatase [Lachnoclostridium sp. An138]
MRAWGMKDVGRCRDINQDYIFLSEEPMGNLPNLFLVADGMGGHRAGDLASEYTVSRVCEAVTKSMQKIPFQILKGAFQYANQKLIEKAGESPAYAGMGTTLVAVTVQDDTAYVANVGDSRLYKIGGTIEQITEDHSLVEEMVRMGEISKEEARNHPEKNIITRAIGVSETVEPDYFDTKLEKGECLLLCSDGLSNMLEDAQIKEILDRRTDLRSGAEELVREANRNGGKDNIAVVLIESA